MCGSGHPFESVRVGMLEGDVEVGQDQPVGHQRDQVAHVGVGVDVVEADPCPQLAKIAGQAVVFLGRVFDVEAIGAGVLGDDQQFFCACLDEAFCFPDDGVGGS